MASSCLSQLSRPVVQRGWRPGWRDSEKFREGGGGYRYNRETEMVMVDKEGGKWKEVNINERVHYGTLRGFGVGRIYL